MNTIIPAQDCVLLLLGKAKSASSYRLMTYVVTEEVENSVLLFHTLTREMLQLSTEEYARLFDFPELYERWFIVPEDTIDMELTDRIHTTLGTMRKNPEYIRSYTIFTTTDCNARCFYCFEKGAQRLFMNEETALQTVKFIEQHCGKKAVRLNWFGGEPLYNSKVIDIIASGLKERNIPFFSTMISNAYLFDEELIKKSKAFWNLMSIQTTLDGTKQVYNQTKNYIYSNDSDPFETVLSNIEKCLENKIQVTIRLNVTEVNAEDLMELIHQLYQRFGADENLTIYPKILYEIAQNPNMKSAEVYAQTEDLEKLIRKYRLQSENKIDRNLKFSRCQADNLASVTILPDGKLGVCEHLTDSHYIGDIKSGTIDTNMRKVLKESYPPFKECAGCFYYPECIRPKACSLANVCTESMRKKQLSDIRERMRNSLKEQSADFSRFQDSHPHHSTV